MSSYTYMTPFFSAILSKICLASIGMVEKWLLSKSLKNIRQHLLKLDLPLSRGCGKHHPHLYYCLLYNFREVVLYNLNHIGGRFALAELASKVVKLLRIHVCPGLNLKGLSHGILSYFEHRKNNR